MQHFKDNLTYTTLAGRRKLRRYVMAALVIGLFAAGLSLFSQGQRAQARAEVFAPPRPVRAAAEEMSAPPDTPAALPATPAACPEDPAAWHFYELFPGQNLKRIAPDCVYEGLARTVAWHMLVRMGYPKNDAAARLGFAENPYRPVASVRTVTSLKGPRDLAVTMEWGPHPDYRYWTLAPDGAPGMAYSLQGCVRARSVVGNQSEPWGPYAVHCLVAVDYAPGWTVHELGPYRYTANWADQPGARTFVLFGYEGEGRWVLVGELPDLYVSHDQLGEDLAGEREAAAERHGLSEWDSAWLFETYGFEPYPLTPGWQTMTDPAALGPMGEALNQYAEAPE